jgi:hypothetical protein
MRTLRTQAPAPARIARLLLDAARSWWHHRGIRGAERDAVVFEEQAHHFRKRAAIARDHAARLRGRIHR